MSNNVSGQGHENDAEIQGTELETTEESATLEADETVKNEPETEVDAEDGDDGHDEDAEGDEREDKGINKGSKSDVEQRIGKLTKQKYKAQQEAEYWKQLALEREAARNTKAEPQQEQPAQGKPTLAQHGYDQEAYLDALAEWKLAQAVERRTVQTQREQEINAYNKRVRQYMEVNDEYEDAIQDMVRLSGGVSQVLAEGLIQSEIAPEIEFYLSQNIDLFKKLNSMSPLQVGRELGKIESKLMSEKAPKVAVQAPVKTKAPAPIKPVKTGAVAPVKDISEMSFEEYEKFMNEQWRKRNKS